MSYILDALKQSEAERSNTDQTELGHRVPFATAPRKQREIWPYLLVMALMANAAVIAYLVWPESGPGNDAVVSGEVAPVQRRQPVEQATASTSPEPSMQEEAEAPEAPEASKASDASAPVRAEDSPSDSLAEKPAEVPDINAMPRSVQKRVPEMTFNGHVYSSTPSSRRVMINNRALREGDRVDGLVIEEITPAGVVFRLDKHVFGIDVVRDWQGGPFGQ